MSKTCKSKPVKGTKGTPARAQSRTTSPSSPDYLSSSSTPTNEPTGSSTNDSDCLFGCLQNVSPTKVTKKGSDYFTFTIQEKDCAVKAICFSPRKHKYTVETTAESSRACKITKFSHHPSEENVVWINQNTNIDDTPETKVNFSYKESSTRAQLATTKDLDDIRVFESVTVRGLVLFGNNTAEQVPTKPGLTKLEGCFVDESGSIRITIWNEQIEQIENNEYYEMENIHVRQYFGQKYLSASIDTVFKKVTSNLPQLSPEDIKKAQNEIMTNEIKCRSFLSVETSAYYSCVTCNRKVQFRQDSVMLKCSHCSGKFLIKNSTKTLTARVSVKNDDSITWYSLFTPVLEVFVQNYNEKYKKNEVVENIDEDKLSEIILVSEGLTLRVNKNSNTVSSVTFV